MPRYLFSTTCLAAALLCAAVAPALANPLDGTVAAGQATISESGTELDVNQQSDKAVIDWRGFDIAPGELTAFHQPNSGSITVNRVNSTSISRIDGQLTANGNIVIINQNGIMFGKTAHVDVNGLIATTADIDNNAFMNNATLHFDRAGNPNAVIVNEGEITAKDEGMVGLVAPNVINSGIITAKLGHVQLASGDTLALDIYGDELMKIAVTEDVQSQLVSNTGIIRADGGHIALTAAAGEGIVNSLIAQSGALEARSVDVRNGEIIISAAGSNKTDKQGSSTVLVGGTVDASGRNAGERGGKITVTGDNIALLNGAVIDASGRNGLSNTTAGQAKSAKRIGSAGGEILIGGDYLGQGDIQTAKTLYVDPGAAIFNDALETGDAGRVIFWSDETTRFYGNVYARALGGLSADPMTGYARAGGNAGNGGFVETSGHKTLEVGGTVDLTASNGARGTYFLDPTNITIYGNVAPDYATVIDGDTASLQSSLALWLDAADPAKVTLNYNTNYGGTTVTSASGNQVTVTNATGLVPGARIRLGAGGNALASVTQGTDNTSDVYTIRSISGNVLTLDTPIDTSRPSYTNAAVYQGYITQIAGKSLGGNSANQVNAANMPLWISNGKNGLGVASFDGNNDRMAFDPSSLTTFSLASVFANNNAGSSGIILGGAGDRRVSFDNDSLGYTSNANIDVAALYPSSLGYNSGYVSNTLNGSSTISRNGVTYTAPGLSGGDRVSVRYLGTADYQPPIDGQIGEVSVYDTDLSANARSLIDQYQAAKWDIALNPLNNGNSENAQATTDGAYSVFTTRYLERLSQSADVSLQASNNVNLDLQGDTLNFATADRSLALTAGNQITTASAGNITTNGGDITFNAANGILLNHALGLDTNGGDLTFGGDTILGADQNLNAGSGDMRFTGKVNGSHDLIATADNITFARDIGGDTPLDDVSLTSANTLALPSINAGSIVARTTGADSDLTLGAGKVLTASGTGTPVTLVAGRNFVNNAGNGAIALTGDNAPRFLVYSTSPSGTMGEENLGADFKRYSCAYGGTCPVLGSGSGLLYNATPLLIATPDAVNATYGDAVDLAHYGYALSGYLDTDAASDAVTGALAGDSAYAQGGNAGTYRIDYASGALASALGYGFTYADNVNGLTIDPRALTIAGVTANSKVYDGTDVAALNTNTASLSGVINNDAVTLDHGSASGVFMDRHIGNGKAVSVSGFALDGSAASNYILAQPTGLSADITPATLTVTADDASRMRGVANPVFTARYDGFQATDDVSLISGLTLSSPADASSAAGNYAIIPSGASADDYIFTYVNGVLDVIADPILSDPGPMLPNTVIRADQNLPSGVPTLGAQQTDKATRHKHKCKSADEAAAGDMAGRAARRIDSHAPKCTDAEQ